MEKTKNFYKKFVLLKLQNAKTAIRTFNRREHIIFVLLALIFLISFVVFLGKLNSLVSVKVPAEGGTLSEGIVGTPRFVNPVLAFSEADKDLSILIYSGLMRKMPDGSLLPDIAQSFNVSENGLVYTFVIKPNVVFHDNNKITADDIVFTIEKIKDPVIKSPLKVNWEGVTVKKIDDKTVSFTLKQPYAPFLEQTTVGILPSHLWKKVLPEEWSFSDYNIEAIGTGPFKISNIKKKSGGSPSQYTLKRFRRFALSAPYIHKMVIKFYPNENEITRGFENNEFENMSSVTPERALFYSEHKARLETAVLPRVFALFFNQNESTIFTDKNVIKAFDLAINKDRIIKEVLYGFGVPLESPLPEEIEVPRSNPEEARKILASSGWKLNESGVMEKKTGKETKTLSFSISTGDVPELKYAAELIKKDLEAIGVKVEVKVYDIGDLNQNIIRPRKYESLFFGQIVGSVADLYAFWHSSQRNDPGLNVAVYTSNRTDKILEDLIRQSDREEKNKLLERFKSEIKKDSPAVFVYSPEFIYIVPNRLKGLELGNIKAPSDRFMNSHKWHVETDSVWKIFKN